MTALLCNCPIWAVIDRPYRSLSSRIVFPPTRIETSIRASGFLPAFSERYGLAIHMPPVAGMMNKRQIYEFSDFRVDTGQFILSKAGLAQPITPTVFKILLILLQRAGEVITKEELMKQVWPDSFVEDGNLN